MKLLLEQESGFHNIIEFNSIDFSEGGQNDTINMVAIHIWKDSFEPNTQGWFYRYNVKNEKEFQIVKEHIQKIINQLMELDYVKTSDFPINGIDGKFYDNWGWV